MGNTGIILDEIFAEHATGWGHPEQSDRISVIIEQLKNSGLLQACTAVAPEPASLEMIQSIHTPDYIERLRQACQSEVSYIDTPDSAICAKSFDIACLAVGSLLKLVDSVMREEVRNGFAVVRPPGHHAEAGRSMGFCLFNSIAIAARQLIAVHKLNRVLILDWDVHHGNGTQHSFAEDPQVFYASLHAHPASFYPGTGYEGETGEGEAKGTTLNCPMLPGSGDKEYREAFFDELVPAVEQFKPEFILISAGFDAHRDDMISPIQLEDETFRWLSSESFNLAQKYAQGRVVSVLEGGYNLDALARCAEIHLDELIKAAENLGG